uniref:Uncharacterized protein n=1 Tax=Eucampia antarctica TaxID=49252 RepID=A0A7S2SLA9_9STRA|mmetsp:Transcript_9861/g.9540  ORF Transcript_9861/g.9540 Transcript_9861/m.9540 type:complete len:397 (+) Transcript_9861:70-1260(+)|eukprot:CAMPEP_0197834830 /NCGR_PEP_ID=MMETSP1437-20131217/23868_1 /TAXON_ID=49252 ORGANISM="Eucampia antarctica, Strain CCMP1452" /NCGR_SAMPLE_ID=MMETSP1437 /ASSEMBLY_ACC=CAM_ASM_001096 /LENGTH=396 /DNA_ID=CAMNT_0043439829 /DNA_START=60 /DNA_END=1250 /DNA_ORIENTATION=+
MAEVSKVLPRSSNARFFSHQLITKVLVGLLLIVSGSSFVVVPNSIFISVGKETQPSVLWMGRKKGALGGAVDFSNPHMPKKKSKKKKKKVSSSSSSSSSSNEEKVVSSKLADWASMQQGDATDSNDTTFSATNAGEELFDDEDSSSSEMNRKGNNKNKKSSSERRLKQSQRMVEDSERDERICQIIEDIESSLEELKNENSGVLDGIRQLCSIQQQQQQKDNNMSMRQFIASADAFRLTWVGSDNAVTHIGTGLQKVPLARLEEVFLRFSMKGKRIEVLEVLRILGPFPNIRNTLVGDVSSRNKDNLSFSYNSMIDGTGKEILAGTESKKKKVDLQVLFADKNALVLLVPPSDDDDDDNVTVAINDDYIFRNNGENILFFTKQADLDEELAKLRVN